MLFKIKNKTLTHVKEKPVRFEKDLQKVFEQNLEKIFRLRLVKSECSIQKKKIDTLAYDPQSLAFVIIEYKKEKSPGLFDQGVAYLNLMLQNKGELRSAYNDSRGSAGYMDSAGVKWQNSKIIFVSPEFTPNQLLAAEYWQSIPLGREFTFELWEVKMFENGSLYIFPVKKSQPGQRADNYAASEARLLAGKPDETAELYEELKKSIMQLRPGITVNPKMREVGFILKGRKFCDVSIHQGYIKLWLNIKRGTLSDPKKITRNVQKVRHWGSGDYEIRMRDNRNLQYIMGLVSQSITEGQNL